MKKTVIRNASTLLAFKNRGLTHKLEAYFTVYGQTISHFSSIHIVNHFQTIRYRTI